MSRHDGGASSSEMENHAEDHIRYIRDVMERTSTFTAVPGRGMIAMGCTALIAAAIASQHLSSPAWLRVWFVDAIVAVCIGGSGLVIKARRAGTPLQSGAGRKFIMSFIPSLFVGLIVSIGLWQAGYMALMPGIWMMMYGVGTIAGGEYSVRVVPVMGICFLLTGAGALFMPLAWSNALMAVSYGGFHLVFGWIIARNHGG